MFVLVCYDIGDVAGEGSERLKKVAQACLNYGVLVQYSVFECRINTPLWVMLRAKLLQIHDPKKDSLRFYALCENDERKVEVHGINKLVDPTGPLTGISAAREEARPRPKSRMQRAGRVDPAAVALAGDALS